jgi:hypothetical protein
MYFHPEDGAAVFAERLEDLSMCFTPETQNYITIG